MTLSPTETSNEHIKKNLEYTMLGFAILGTVSILAWVLHYSNYGFDFTDESFYLVWISNPFIYEVSASQFGFVYHPLYQLLNGNIAALRQANVLITFGLTSILIYTLLKALVFPDQGKKIQCLVIATGFATASLSLFQTWLLTPNYNSLALQALIIVATGLLFSEYQTQRANILGWILIGIGGWLAFMAKPTTAAALCVAVCIYSLTSPKLGMRALLVSALFALIPLILSAWIIDASITEFTYRLKGGVEVASLLGGGYTLLQLLRIDDFLLSEVEEILFLGVAICLFMSSIFLRAKRTAICFVGAVCIAAFLAFILCTTTGATERLSGLTNFRGLLLCAITVAAVFLAFAFSFSEEVHRPFQIRIGLAALFFVFPHFYAFGTNGNYWRAGTDAGVFWILSGLTVLVPVVKDYKSKTTLLPLVVATQAIVAAIILTGVEAPYRQPQPLSENNFRIEIGRSGSNLMMSKNYGEYFKDAIDGAKQAAFVRNTPVIDLSGQSPGILYAMNAMNVGQAWTIGGYSGSDRLAIHMFKNIKCQDLATSWLLVEPNGPRSLSSNIIESFGANLITDYETVASWDTAKGAGGYKEIRVQKLLKPIRPKKEATDACDLATRK